MEKKKEISSNFLKKEKQPLILEEEKEIHNIFDGMNEDKFTKASRKAIRQQILDVGMEDPEEELREESTEKNIEEDEEERL